VRHGLFRVQAFTQDDAHHFCTPEQIESEIAMLIAFFREVYAKFDLHDVRIELSTRPEKSIGSDAIWEKAECALRGALDVAADRVHVNAGDGAFYGPKIDFHIRDVLKRSWQCGTIQLDFSMPERFGLTYIGPDGQKHTPVMIHRACYGSIERFLGILIEHYAGRFPLWLAPVQVVVIPVSDKFVDYARACTSSCSTRAARRGEPQGRPRRLQDPRGEPQEAPLRDRGRRARAGRRHAQRALARRGVSWGRCRSSDFLRARRATRQPQYDDDDGTHLEDVMTDTPST
jgi:threonyl-tRNA synthetase